MEVRLQPKPPVLAKLDPRALKRLTKPEQRLRLWPFRNLHLEAIDACPMHSSMPS